MWIITEEYNLYDQEGEYFVAFYYEKPDFHTLKELLPNETDKTIGRLTRGGGRENNEHQWYNLHKVEEGQVF